MSEHDKRALETNFAAWRQDRAPQEDESKAFEIYCIEQILKDDDLSDEEIESGNFGGKDDGGIDAMYFFINRLLIQDETQVPMPALNARLAIIQAKYEVGFKESAIERLRTFTEDLLNYSREPEDIPYLNAAARDGIRRFREKYEPIIGTQHTLDIDFHYAIKGDTGPNPKVTDKVAQLKKFVKGQLSAANVSFAYWDCTKLLAAARTPLNASFKLEFTQSFATADEAAVVCIATLKKFAEFITDEHGELRRNFFEPNVRDYQGKGNPVNKDIRETLNSAENKEFWWLNNGVTILATSHSLSGNKLTIAKPEIVNGLQTSQEIYSFFKSHPDKADSRNVLVRVIAPPDEKTRNRITKATNNQTPIPPVSLHAADDIHWDIEDSFKLYGLFYDRRKGEYRNRRKPISKIISIPTLAKAVMAIKRQRPDDARARPQSVLNKEDVYSEVFNDKYSRDLYVACVHLDRQVDQYLNGREDLTSETHRDIRYYVDMWLICKLAHSAAPSVEQIVNLRPQFVKGLPVDQIQEACAVVLEEYGKLGGNDKVAKGTDLRKALMDKLAPISVAAE
jgi:hypothetical protein